MITGLGVMDKSTNKRHTGWYEADVADKEIERLKKELNINKADFREVNTVMIPKVSARIYKLEDDNRQLKKEKEWLIDRCVKNEHYIHNLWAPDQLSEKERREKITKA